MVKQVAAIQSDELVTAFLEMENQVLKVIL
jgi:hypothetical protein